MTQLNKMFDELFEDEVDIDLFHDAMLLATDKQMSIEQLKYHFSNLPNEIQMLAYQWGFNDTEFRDKLYYHYLHNDSLLK